MLSLIILAFSLSIDALSIGLSYGLKKIKIPLSAKIIIGLICFLITYFSICFGKVISRFIPDYIFKTLGILMLFVMGALIIYQSFKKEEYERKKNNNDSKLLSFIINSYVITIKIIRDPKSGDMNNSFVIEPLEAVYIGIALCMDSIGISMASVSLGFNNSLLPILVSIMQILFLTAGDLIGNRIIPKKNNEKLILAMSGGLLILIAFSKLF